MQSHAHCWAIFSICILVKFMCTMLQTLYYCCISYNNKTSMINKSRLWLQLKSLCPETQHENMNPSIKHYGWTWMTVAVVCRVMVKYLRMMVTRSKDTPFITFASSILQLLPLPIPTPPPPPPQAPSIFFFCFRGGGADLVFFSSFVCVIEVDHYKLCRSSYAK